MEDSPLSITASIAGILTFIAAIFAFTYVRYNTLRDGEMEMSTILESVMATVKETGALVKASPLSEFEDDSGPDLRKSLIKDLYATEIEIMALYMRVYGTGLASMQPNAQSDGSDSEIHQHMIETFERERKTQQERGYFSTVNGMLDAVQGAIQIYPTLVIAFEAVRFVINLGESRTTVRWYSVRKKVLEKIKKREVTRSRLLHYQISASNL
jgi:hypothetical protein